jgi:hypothetical protein
VCNSKDLATLYTSTRFQRAKLKLTMDYRGNTHSVTCKIPRAQFEDSFVIVIRPKYIGLYAVIIYLFLFERRSYRNKVMYF